jgi:hypothetical protein
MKSKLALSAQTFAVCVLLGALPAGASTIQIGLAEGTGTNSTPGSISTVATGAGTTGVAWAGSYDKYIFNVVMASDPNPIDLTSGTINVKGPNATVPIYLYVTETGLTSSPGTLDFSSILGVSNLPAGWSLTESTYLGTTDTAFDTSAQTAIQLASATTSNKTVNSTQTFDAAATVGSMFSITEVYELFSDGVSGIVGASETVQGAAGIEAAPAPAIGSGIPGLLAVGGVLLGWKLWERRRQA